jgi:hypothetical protein
MIKYLKAMMVITLSIALIFAWCFAAALVMTYMPSIALFAQEFYQVPNVCFFLGMFFVMLFYSFIRISSIMLEKLIIAIF